MAAGVPGQGRQPGAAVRPRPDGQYRDPHAGARPRRHAALTGRLVAIPIPRRVSVASAELGGTEMTTPNVATMTGEEIRALVRPGRVHRRIYSDPDIFNLELERIFGSAWIYVGHESQIKAPGDFVATRIGRKPLLLVRDAEGRIQLLHNQCAHRGSMVVASEAGHSPELRCCYHGWTYHLDGRLKVAPLLHGYPPHFDPKSPEFAMRRVPRVASYRGFVFGSLANQGASLEDFLGYMTTS